MENIIAIASPIGIGAISILRASGDSVISEINKVFKGKNLTTLEKNTFTYGKIVTPEKEVIDDVVILVYKAPNSFTGEDSVEITCHGGPLVCEEVLNTILKNTNVKMALPGEFSKRAYLNKKIDIVEAESIMSLIYSENKNALKIARAGLDKKISQKILNIANKLLDFLTIVEVDIDYPEFEKQTYTKDEINNLLANIKKSLENFFNDSNKTSLITNGANVLILGLPNAGKSSLLNNLLKEKRAIVSDIAGTTRDIIKESINVDGFKINLIDTAGIRKTTDKIEKIGVSIATKEIKKADIIILLLDKTKNDIENNLFLLRLTRKKKRIICLNKDDQNLSLDLEKLALDKYIPISTKTSKGIKELKKEIIHQLDLDKMQESNYINLFSKRQLSKLEKVISYLNDAILNVSTVYDTILLATDIKKAYDTMLEIIGKVYDDDLEKNIFKNFCLGK